MNPPTTTGQSPCGRLGQTGNRNEALVSMLASEVLSRAPHAEAWRCGAERPPHRWPWRDAAAQSAFEEWDRRYQLSAHGHATCRLFGQFGNPVIQPALESLIPFHDETTRAISGLPLA